MRRAFSMVELAVTLVIIGLLVALGVGYSKTAAQRNQDLGGNLSLASVRAEINQKAYSNGSEFPQNLNELSIKGVTFETGPSNNPSQVSLHQASSTVVVLAQRTVADGCVWVYNSLTERAKWGIDENGAEYCNAETIMNHPRVNAETLSTDPIKPSNVGLD